MTFFVGMSKFVPGFTRMLRVIRHIRREKNKNRSIALTRRYAHILSYENKLTVTVGAISANVRKNGSQ
jgi:hypothetical protein